MRLLSNLHVKGKPAVLPDSAIRRQSHYFIYRPHTFLKESCFSPKMCNFSNPCSCKKKISFNWIMGIQ